MHRTSNGDRLHLPLGILAVAVFVHAATVAADPIEPSGSAQLPSEAPNTNAKPEETPPEEIDFAANIWANDPRLKGEKFDAARKALAENKLADCLRMLGEAGDLDSTLPPVEVMLAYLYLGAGRFNEGVRALDIASIAHRDYPEIYYAAGQIALGQGRNLDAWVQFDKAMQMKAPETWTKASQANFKLLCLAGLATVAERRSDWSGAEALFAQWAKADPQDSHLFDRWGTAFFMLGKADLAFEKFKRSYDLDATALPPELSLAALWSMQSNSSRADEWYKKALAAYPNDYRVYREYGGGLLLAAKYAEARTQLDQAADLAKSSADADQGDLLLLRGYAARALKDYQQAEAHFTDLLKASPGHFEALRQLPLVLVEQDDPEKREQALQFAQALVHRYPQTPSALATLGWVQFRLGQKLDAEQSLKAASIDPNIETLYFLGQVLMAAGKTSEAKEVVDALKPRINIPALTAVRADAQKWLDRVSLVLP